MRAPDARLLELGATRRIEPAGTRGQAALPGTCGELFQGLVDGEPCLVSCPIDRLNCFPKH